MKNRKRIQLSKNFFLDEYIPKEMYRAYPDWMLLRPVNYNLINAYQKVRERHGARTLNNWWNGGNRNESGLRIVGQAYYKPLASHAFFNAGDSIGITPVQEIWEDIETNYKKVYRELGVRAIEKGLKVSWLHLDMGNFEGLQTYDKGELYIIKI